MREINDGLIFGLGILILIGGRAANRSLILSFKSLNGTFGILGILGTFGILGRIILGNLACFILKIVCLRILRKEKNRILAERPIK